VASPLETVVIVEPDSAVRDRLYQILQEVGYDVRPAATPEEGFRAVLSQPPDVFILSTSLDDSRATNAISEIKELSATSQVHVIVLTTGGPAERARALQTGADDVVSAPWDEAELLARVRTQLRHKRATEQLALKAHNAEESYQVAQTAFQALAVTEKMTRDAFSLERILKIGVVSLFSIALVIAGIFFLFSRKADKETRRAYSVIAQLERGVKNEEQLLESARRLREDPSNADVLQQKEQLQAQTEALKQKLSAPNGSDVNELRRQLTQATGRLNEIEGKSQAAEGVIRNFAPSVCLLHVSVAFNEKDSGKRVRYGGTDSDGSPLKDSDGNPVYTTEGRGPEVRADFFGTGFIAGEGKIITNHHVVQPWWQNEELATATQQGLEPVIAEMTAYFPGADNGISLGISQISQEADLALVHGDLSELKRPILKLDSRKEAAVSGEALISVGYATGLDAILARAGDETVKQIVKVSAGEPKLVLAELARRKLIRPLVTQGHVGDVLPDKIVYDAQTTSGGSGGPLLVQDGGVIGVTYAIVRGFGGSNFGIPIRYATPLLKH
jgi:DNA-binding response OmpR family regulator/S1-C subfamily serine protease